jgi:FADH2 O2-dependent halogenase
MSRLGITPDSEPEQIWATVLHRYPTIEAQFEGARALRPLEFVERVQHRFDRASGHGWAALPHSFAFVDPIFSTGIAWSLLAVERLAQLFESRSARNRAVGTRDEIDFSRYGRLLEAEADQILRLTEGAYRAMHDFDLFTAQSFLYFSTVSFLEVQQRLFAGNEKAETMAWRGFLGADDPELEQMFMEAKSRLDSLSQTKGIGDYPVLADSFKTWIQERIACRNVIGLGDPTRDNLYPVDLDVMRSHAELLGLTGQEMRSRLHLLRGRE